MTEMRVLWLSLEAGLWPSHELEHRAADALARTGAEVTVIRCDGILDRFCPVMQADRLTPETPSSRRRAICKGCRFNRELTRQDAAYDTVFLDDFVTSEIRKQARSMALSVREDDWESLELQGLPIGRYAAYLSLLNHKVLSPADTPEAWSEYLADLESSIVALLALPNVLQRFSPTHGAVYDPLYPVHRMFVELCLRSEVQLATLSAGDFVPDRYSTLVVYPHYSSSQTLIDSATAQESLAIPISATECETVTSNLRALMIASDPWVYSAPVSDRSPDQVRSCLGMRRAAPAAVVLVGSPDETRASRLVSAEYERVPLDELSDVPEFLDTVLQAASSIRDVDVLIRLHPRLGVNKRELLESPDLARIRALLADIPDNVHVNAPGDGVGLYDTMRIAACAVNQASSAGLEFMAMGIPVIQYDPPRNNAYPPLQTKQVKRRDPEALAAAIRTAIAAGADDSASIAAFRWYATSLARSSTALAANGPAPSGVPGPPTQEQRAGSVLASVKAIAPRSVRELWARAMARAARRRNFRHEPLDSAVAAELRERFEDLGPRVVWEPPIMVRGEPELDDAAMIMGARDRLRILAGVPRVPSENQAESQGVDPSA